MNFYIMLTVAGTFASIGGLVFAIIQRMKYHNAERNYKKLKRTRKMQIWGNIALAIQAFDKLDPLKEASEDLKTVPDEIKRRITAARQCVVDQYLRLLEQAVLAEDDFTVDSVEKWYKSGRLETEWRRDAAMKFVPTDNLSEFKKKSTQTRDNSEK